MFSIYSMLLHGICFLVTGLTAGSVTFIEPMYQLMFSSLPMMKDESTLSLDLEVDVHMRKYRNPSALQPI